MVMFSSFDIVSGPFVTIIMDMSKWYKKSFCSVDAKGLRLKFHMGTIVAY